MKPELTQARLKELLHYDPETGVFVRRKSRRADLINTRAGATSSEGYCVIKIGTRAFKAHRLAFLYMTGAPPPAEVDHINRDRADNRWVNLRAATARENGGNKGPRRDNASGHRGVSWYKRGGKWRVQGKRNGRKKHLGYFSSLEEAAAVAKAWREEYFGKFAVA